MKLENKILKLSVIGALFFALFGIAWGWAIKSDMIIFDGLYSFISVILSMISLYINKYMAKRKLTKELVDAFVSEIVFYDGNIEVKLLYDDFLKELLKVAEEREVSSNG